jgi:hypothetical protein
MLSFNQKQILMLDVCEDDDAVFVNKSVVSAGNLNYNWKFGDASNSSSQSPRHRYKLVVFLKHSTLLWLPWFLEDVLTL